MAARKNKIVPAQTRKVGRPRKVRVAVAEAGSPKETKLAMIIRLLKRPEGALLEELAGATGWQPHSVRGQMSNLVKKQRELKVTYTPERRGKVYRIVGAK